MAIARGIAPESLLPGGVENYSQLSRDSRTAPNTALVYKDIYSKLRHDCLDERSGRSLHESARTLPLPYLHPHAYGPHGHSNASSSSRRAGPELEEVLWGVQRYNPRDPRDLAPRVRFRAAADAYRARDRDPLWVAPEPPALTTYIDYEKAIYGRDGVTNEVEARRRLEKGGAGVTIAGHVRAVRPPHNPLNLCDVTRSVSVRVPSSDW